MKGILHLGVILDGFEKKKKNLMALETTPSLIDKGHEKFPFFFGPFPFKIFTFQIPPLYSTLS